MARLGSAAGNARPSSSTRARCGNGTPTSSPATRCGFRGCTAVHRAVGGGARADRAGGVGPDRRRDGRRPSGGGRRGRVRLPRRLDRRRDGRADRAGVRARRRGAPPADRPDRVRRLADAGGHAGAGADGQARDGGALAARGGPAVHRLPDRPDDRRRPRVVGLARDRHPRTAGCAPGLRRPPRGRAHHRHRAAHRCPTRRDPPRRRPDRRDRPARGPAPDDHAPPRRHGAGARVSRRRARARCRARAGRRRARGRRAGRRHHLRARRMGGVAACA